MSVSFKFLAVAALIAGASSGVGVAFQGDTSMADADAKAIVAYQENWAKGDAKALAASYDSGAVAVSDAGVVVGRTAIEQMFTANFAGPWKGTTAKITPGKTHTLSPEIRVGEGTYEISGLMDSSGKSLPPIRGRYMNTTINRGGIWIIADQATFPVTQQTGTR
jgi:uncharacterized protein (TIGR02246 family)